MKIILRSIILLGLFFLILFTGYSSFANMLTRVHQQEGLPQLGPFLLGVNYTFFMLTNIIAPSIKLSYKKQMLIASICYTINYSTGFFLQFVGIVEKYILSAFGAILGGSTAAMLWTSLGGYIHQLCEKNNAQVQKGKYYGTFSSIYCINDILGALITTFGLGFFSHNIYFLILIGIGTISAVFCFFFVEEVKRPQRQQPFSPIKSLVNLLKFYPNMKFLLPLILIDGLILGITTASLNHVIPEVDNENEQNIRAGICFLIYGIGGVSGGYTCGYFVDNFRLKISGYNNLFFTFITCMITFMGIEFQNYIIICLAFYCWGFTLYYNQGWVMIMCSKVFKGALESFAITKQFHSFIYVLYQIYIISTGNKIDFRYVLCFLVLVLMAVAFGLYNFIDRNQGKLNKQSLLEKGEESSQISQQQNSIANN